MFYAGVIIVPENSVKENKKPGLLGTSELTMAKQQIRTYLKSGVSEVAVLIAGKGKTILDSLEEDNVHCIHFEDREIGFLEMAGYGLKLFSDRFDKIFVSSIYVDGFYTETLLELMGCSADVVIPKSGGVNTHPLLFRSRLANWISVYNGKRGLKGAIESVTATGNASVQVIDCDMINVDRYIDARNIYKKMIHVASPA